MKRPRLLDSPLTGSVYVVTRYTEQPDGLIVATTKHDVTDDFEVIRTRRPSTEEQRLREALRQIAEGDYPSEAGNAETWAQEVLANSNAVNWQGDEDGG